MTNKEKLEIIDKALKKVYTTLEVIANDDRIKLSPDISKSFSYLTKSIYNLESTKLLLEPLPNLPTIYECSFCGERISCYGEFIKGECLNCGCALVKKD